MPAHLLFDGDWYRRRDQTPNRSVATRFGTITLWRYLYQPIHGVERSIFPLEIRLGLAAGRATPALAERVAHAAADSTQGTVLADLKRDQGVTWSVATLRLVIATTWEGMAPHFQAAQVTQVLAWIDLSAAICAQRHTGHIVTTAGIDVSSALIGEIWQLGTAVVQVTSPRIPCVTFQSWLDEPHWVKRFAAAGRPGAYLRVLTEGAVAPGDEIVVASRLGRHDALVDDRLTEIGCIALQNRLGAFRRRRRGERGAGQGRRTGAGKGQRADGAERSMPSH